MHVHGDILDRQDTDTLPRCLVSSRLDKKKTRLDDAPNKILTLNTLSFFSFSFFFLGEWTLAMYKILALVY